MSFMVDKQPIKLVKKGLKKTDWDFSNNILYKLCADHPRHKRDYIIMAKVMLIGRAYSAAIERGREANGGSGDKFYKNKVAGKIRNSDIDKWFSELGEGKKDKRSRNEQIALELEIHMNVMKLFNKISKLDKRSLAAKYLHFHFPDRFYIFDSRAQNAVSKLTEPIGRSLPRLRKHDNVYARFCYRCEVLNNRIASLVGRRLSPRELDKVLLAADSYHLPNSRTTKLA
jgi:hypothetical protein